MAAPRTDDVKGKIMDAAERLMLREPLDSISLARIAAEAGVSKGTLYYHYKTKDEILFGLTDRYLERQWDEFLAWVDDAGKDTSLNRLVRYVMQRNVTNEQVRMHLLYGAAHDGAIREKLNRRYSDFAALIASRVRERIAPPPDADYLAWLILLACDGLIVQKSLGGGLDADDFIERSAELIKTFKCERT